MDLNFCKMTFADYTALAEVDAKTFYYITDTGDLYQGTKLLNAKFWSGTQAQYNVAVASGNIPPGTIVEITDSPTPTGTLEEHVATFIHSANGIHGIRYYQDKLEYYDETEEEWVEIETGSSVTPLGLRITSQPTKTTYYDVETLDLTGVRAVLDYSDGTTVDVTSSVSFVPADGSSLTTNISSVTANYGGYTANIPITVKKTIIYGFSLNGTESAPASMISYKVQYDGKNVDNYNYTSAAVNLSTGVMNPGSWNLTDDFFVPRSCMLKYDGTVDYYLNESDETKKEDGTSSDVANTSYGGNAMMEWGRNGEKIWVKIVPNSTPTSGATFYVSNFQVDSGFKCYPFYDCDGKQIDHFYTPKYNGSAISSKLRSISGQTPCNNQTGSTEITYATANNVNGKTEWYTEVIADRMLINILLLMIGKSCNTQAVFGQGYTTRGSGASSLATTGTLNGKGQWYGSSTNNSKTAGVKVFGMEHYWGNVWRRHAGYLNVSGTVKYKMTYSTVDGSTVSGYNATGSGYLTVANGTPGGTSGGYTNVMVFNEHGMFNKTASGSETTYYADGLWFNNSQTDYAFVGGACDSGARCGALCVILDGLFSHTYWGIGASPSCKPLG